MCSLNKLLNSNGVFHTTAGLNPAADVDPIGRGGLDDAADIVWGQATGQDQPKRQAGCPGCAGVVGTDPLSADCSALQNHLCIWMVGREGSQLFQHTVVVVEHRQQGHATRHLDTTAVLDLHHVRGKCRADRSDLSIAGPGEDRDLQHMLRQPTGEDRSSFGRDPSWRLGEDKAHRVGPGSGVDPGSISHAADLHEHRPASFIAPTRSAGFSERINAEPTSAIR